MSQISIGSQDPLSLVPRTDASDSSSEPRVSCRVRELRYKCLPHRHETLPRPCHFDIIFACFIWRPIFVMADSVLKDWEKCDKTDTLFIVVCTCICWTIVPTVNLSHDVNGAIELTRLLGWNCVWRILVEVQWPCQRHPRRACHHDLLDPVVDCRVHVGLRRGWSGIWEFCSSLSPRCPGRTNWHHPCPFVQPVPARLRSNRLCHCCWRLLRARETSSHHPIHFCSFHLHRWLVMSIPLTSEPFQLWSTFIYCPLAHMVWGGGFLGETLGALDFAGGEQLLVSTLGQPQN